MYVYIHTFTYTHTDTHKGMWGLYGRDVAAKEKSVHTPYKAHAWYTHQDTSTYFYLHMLMYLYVYMYTHTHTHTHTGMWGL